MRQRMICDEPFLGHDPLHSNSTAATEFSSQEIQRSLLKQSARLRRKKLNSYRWNLLTTKFVRGKDYFREIHMMRTVDDEDAHRIMYETVQNRICVNPPLNLNSYGNPSPRRKAMAHNSSSGLSKLPNALSSSLFSLSTVIGGANKASDSKVESSNNCEDVEAQHKSAFVCNNCQKKYEGNQNTEYDDDGYAKLSLVDYITLFDHRAKNEEYEEYLDYLYQHFKWGFEDQLKAQLTWRDWIIYDVQSGKLFVTSLQIVGLVFAVINIIYVVTRLVEGW